MIKRKGRSYVSLLSLLTNVYICMDNHCHSRNFSSSLSIRLLLLSLHLAPSLLLWQGIAIENLRLGAF